MEDLKDIEERMMERTRAAVCLTNGVDDEKYRKGLRLAAFMSIFHHKNITMTQAKEMLR